MDEAGRGSVIGPLVVAGVAIEESKLSKLKERGIKDSKMLTPRKRKILYREIKSLADGIAIEKVQPAAIDKTVFAGQKLFRLNYLEARSMARVLAQLTYDRAHVDCCDTNQKRFGIQISEIMAEVKGVVIGLGEKNPFVERLHSEHHADKNHPVVSAASIIAKVVRDSSIERLQKSHGNFGSGYPSDADTISFLKEHYEQTKNFPSIVRQSWLTIRRMKGELAGNSSTEKLRS